MTGLRLAIPAGAFLLLASLALAVSSAGAAQANLVRIEPPGTVVAPDGTFHAKVVDTPSPDSTAVWAIDVSFDPAVLSTSDEQCDPLNTPGGALAATGCNIVDRSGDNVPETAVLYGAVIFNGTGKGLTTESVLVDITFKVIGQAGACSDLRVFIRSHADNNGKETGALVQDGRACIAGNAPPVGTSSPNPVTPRTSAPTPEPTRPGDGGDTGAPNGQTAAPGGGGTGQPTGSNGETVAPGASNGSTGPSGRSATPKATQTPAGGVDTDSGGPGAVVWVVVGAIVLALAAGGAWSIVRMRGKPPSDGIPPVS